MTQLLAIDPGLRLVGWAFFNHGILQSCGLAAGLTTCGTRGPEAWRAVVDDLPRFEGRFSIVSEFPQLYSVRNVNPDDLLQLAGVVGAIAQRWPEHPMTTVLPREWKGQRSKEATTAQAYGALDAGEAVRLSNGLGTVAQTLQHNVMDAVAIGLVTLHRMR